MHAEIIKRLEGLREPDFYTDEEIYFAIGYAPTLDAVLAPRNYTASLDTAVALVERVLPGAKCRLEWVAAEGKTRWPAAEVYMPGERTMDYMFYIGPNHAIAVLVALFKALEYRAAEARRAALQAQEGRDG